MNSQESKSGIDRLSLEERETFIRTNDKGGDWEFFTLSPIWARKLERLGYQLEKDRQGGWSCPIQRCFVRVRSPKKRQLSEKQRQALMVQANALRGVVKSTA